MIRRARAAPPPRSTAAEGSDYAQQILQHTLDILVSIGDSPKKLSETFARLCATRTEPRERFDVGKASEVTDLPHVVSRWYSDPHYLHLDGEFRPRALPLRGQRLSLSSLIRGVMPRANVGATVRRLLEVDAIRKAGMRYLPNDRYLSFAGVPVLAHAYVLMALLGQLVTVKHNLSCKHAEDKLLQRVVSNPSIPIRLVPHVREEIRGEAIDCLWRIDELLRQYEVRPRSEPTARVGLSACAFEYPLIATTSLRDVSVPARETARRSSPGRKAPRDGARSVSRGPSNRTKRK